MLENAEQEHAARNNVLNSYMSTIEKPGSRITKTETSESGETVQKTYVTYLNGDVAETVSTYDAEGKVSDTRTTRVDQEGNTVDQGDQLTPEQARQQLEELLNKQEEGFTPKPLTSDTIYVPSQLLDAFNQENPGYLDEHGIKSEKLEHGESKLTLEDYEKLPESFKEQSRFDVRDGALENYQRAGASTEGHF